MSYKYSNNIIPLKIFQTWYTKKLPFKMAKTVNEIKDNNKEFEYFLFDDNDCYNFIKDNFSNDVLQAYETLIPSAFKADLWRYCILYFYGGIYLDIKFKPVNNFKFIEMINEEYFVKDIESSNNGIYNGLIISKQRNEKLLNCIHKIVLHTKINYYGSTCWDVTGPTLLYLFFTQLERNLIKLKLNINKNKIKSVINIKNNKTILLEYESYRDEQKRTNPNQHYGILWKNRKIYKKKIET